MEGAGRHFDPAVIHAFTAIEAEFADIRERMGGGGG
jgi:response regulator RpfG family c-di-GMP phosphodiesterase